MSSKRFLVVGLGVLGNSVAHALADSGAEVIALDVNPLWVERLKDVVTLAVQADATDRRALEQLGVTEVDAAIMCIGEGFEAAVLATANLLDVGVKHVAARANSEMQASILQRLGAHDVFFVESAMGRVVARKLNKPEISHEMEIGGGYRILEWRAPKEMFGKRLIDLALPNRFGVHVVAIHHVADREHMKNPSADALIEESDLLVLSGNEKDLAKFFKHYEER